MKKNMIWKAFVAVLAMMMCVSFTSCSDDDDDEPADDNAVAKVEVGYKAELGQGWYDYFDLTATYTAVDGTEVTATLTSNFEYQKYEAEAEAAKTAALKIVATPKATLPTIDESAEYDFGTNITVWIYTYNKSGKELDFGGYSSKSGTDKKSGKEVANYVTGSHNVCNLSHSRE